MRLTVSQSDLQKAISLVSALTERKSTMPVLANILLSTHNNTLRLSATDMEVATIVHVPATIDNSGSIAVSGRVLSDIVRELPEGPVTFELKDRARLLVRSRESQIQINGVAGDEYPTLNGVNLNASNSISPEVLKAMIDGTLYACSVDETRFILNGICLEATADRKDSTTLKMVATDGHRLAMVSRALGKIKIADRVIISKRGVQELRKVLDSVESGNISFDISDGFFVVEGSDAKIATRLIDGEYPDYTVVIPSAPGVTCKVNNRDLYHLLRRISVVLTDKTKKVEITFGPNTMCVRGASSELGEAEENLEVEYQGDPQRIGFNAKYLAEALDSVNDEGKVCIDLHGEFGPAQIWSEGDDSAFAIVMPMRLDS